MSRSAILTLRILAVGSALTVLACHIVNRQEQATAVAGDRGAPGVEASAPDASATRMPGSKSRMVVTAPDMKAPAKPVSPAATPEETRIMGTKSAIMISPRDVQQTAPLLPPPANPPPPPRFAPSSKSGAVVAPSDVQEFQWRTVPQQQSGARQP